MNCLLVFLIVNAFALQMITTVVFAEPILFFGADEDSDYKEKHEAGKKSALKFPSPGNEVKFWCTNSQNVSAEVQLNDPEVKQKLDFKNPINFVIHGFSSDLTSDDWIKGTVYDWVKNCGCNVCAADWGKMASFWHGYKDVATNHTRLAANSVVRFITFLKDNGLDIEQVSMAGHSLGAHISGLVGYALGGKIKAIYGMDPAGPGFERMDDDTKLSPSDAQYVQCIHSDGNSLGSSAKYGCGHANFLMNKGNEQPGCGLIDAICDHGRSHEYFQESLAPDHQFWGIPCSPIDGVAYKNETIDMIGIHSKKTKGNFCVPTNYQSPYALLKEKVIESYWNPPSEFQIGSKESLFG